MTNVAYLRPHSHQPSPQGVATIDDVETIEKQQTDPIGDIKCTFDLLQRGSKMAPDAPALSFFLRAEDYKKPTVWTHREWMAQIIKAANAFRRMGINRSDVIAFILPNLPETHWTIWGGETAGIVFAINPLLESGLMTELMLAAAPKILVTLAPSPGTDLWDRASEAAKSIPTLKQIVTVSPLTYYKSPLAPLLRLASALKTPEKVGNIPVAPFQRVMEGATETQLQFIPPKLTDVASYFCTGGTTGAPKIAVRTHATEVANALELGAAFGHDSLGPYQSVFCGLPLFHVNAQLGTGLTPWANGAHVVLGAPQGYRTPGLLPSFWDIAEHYRFLFFSGVPTVYSALLQDPPKRQDLSQLKYGICGAAPMPIELFNKFQSTTGIKILEGYGLTEGGCVSSVNPPHGETKVGSIGIRLPWQAMKSIILDDQGNFVRFAKTDEVGVIAISGPNLFKGYLNPQHNKGLWIDAPSEHGLPSRWLNTGDLGREDKDGYFWLTGRKKELIIRGGHNIDPKLIEEAMHGHPAVALAAAIGRPDQHAGEVPVVYVQLRPNEAASPGDLIEFAKQGIDERAAWPKQVIIMPTLPTTAIGKIFKPALTMLQLEAVVREEARLANVELTSCQAKQDSKVGMIVQWSCAKSGSSLRDRLSAYTFKNEEVQP